MIKVKISLFKGHLNNSDLIKEHLTIHKVSTAGNLNVIAFLSNLNDFLRNLEFIDPIKYFLTTTC